MGTNLKAVLISVKIHAVHSVCSNMVHFSFINKGICRTAAYLIIDCILVKSCHTLQSYIFEKNIPQTKYNFCIKPGTGNKTFFRFMVINVFWNNDVFCSGNFKVQCISFCWVKKNLQTSVRSIFYRQESVNLLIWSKKKKYKVEIKSHWQAKEFLHSIDFLPIHHYEIHTHSLRRDIL